MINSIIISLYGVAAAIASTGALGQTYPSKPVRLITEVAGGSVDVAARTLAQGLGAAMGQTFVVEARPGAGGIVAVEAVRLAPSDGYTLGFYGSNFWITPLLQQTPYERADFAPVLLAVSSPNVLVVHPSLPVKTVKDLVALAKTKPGELNFGASSVGTGPYLAGQLFRAAAGINVVNVPYKGGAETVNDLLAGRLQFAFTTPGTIAGFIKTDKLRAIAVTSAKPSALLPDLPTVAATLPGFSSATMQGMFASAKVNKSIVNQLNQQSVQFLGRPEIRQKFLELGTEVAGGTPQDFEAIINAEVAKLSPLFKAAGIKSE